MNDRFLMFSIFMALILIGAQLYKQHLEDEKNSKEKKDD